MNFWDMSSPGIGLVVSIPNIVLSTRFMMILWPFLSPWGTIMQSKFIEILFCFYIGKINDLTISSVYFFRNQNLYECLLMRLPAYHLPIRPIFLRLDIKRKTLIINYQCFYKSVGVTRFELATSRPPDAYSKPTELHPVVGFGKSVLNDQYQEATCSTLWLTMWGMLPIPFRKRVQSYNLSLIHISEPTRPY